MKLNKVLALALSGIMAVSMLAGCSNNTNGDKDEQTPVVDTTIAGTLNEKLAEEEVDNVTFQYSDDLQKTVEQVVRFNGGLKSSTDADGISRDVVTYQNYTRISFSDLKENNKAVGTKVAVTTKIASGVTADAAKKNLANAIYNVIGDNLAAETEDTNVKYSHAYTGEVAMVTAEDNGMPVYMVVAVVTCKTTAAANV